MPHVLAQEHASLPFKPKSSWADALLRPNLLAKATTEQILDALDMAVRWLNAVLSTVGPATYQGQVKVPDKIGKIVTTRQQCDGYTIAGTMGMHPMANMILLFSNDIPHARRTDWPAYTQLCFIHVQWADGPTPWPDSLSESEKELYRAMRQTLAGLISLALRQMKL